jgi:hypothetical protein
MSTPQTLANHRRFDIGFHFTLLPLALVNLIWSARNCWKISGSAQIKDLLVALILLWIALKARSYCIRVQDRIIRLEEHLRLARILSEPLKARIHELSEAQLVGLRFASDAEAGALMELMLRENLSGEKIKKHIQTWRPDTFRV